jgi:hypothetical protein
MPLMFDLLRWCEPTAAAATARRAVLERKGNAEFIPRADAAEFIKQADGFAAVEVVAEGSLMGFAAVASCGRAARLAGVITDVTP